MIHRYIMTCHISCNQEMYEKYIRIYVLPRRPRLLVCWLVCAVILTLLHGALISCIYIHILSSGYNNTMYNAKYGMMWFTDISIYFYDLLWYIKRCRNTSIRASVEKKWECCGMQFTRPGKLLLRYPCIASIEMLRSRSPPRVQITASSCSSSSSLVE